MKFKYTLILFFCIFVAMFVTGCQNNRQSASNTNQTTLNEQQTNDDLQKLYGYYTDGYDRYVKITEDLFEERFLPDGTVYQSISIDHIVSDQLETGTIQYKLVPVDSQEKPIYFTLNTDGELRIEDTVSVLISVTQEEYDSLQSLVDNRSEQETPSNAYDTTEEENMEEIPWYEAEFQTYQVVNDLAEIDNLFAVKKKEEAIKMVNEKIFKNLDTRVNQYISERQYWKAQNYVAMYQAYLNPNSYLYGVDYSYLQNYFDDNYKNYSAGIFTATQPYLDKIAQAVEQDTNVVSQQECVYLLNEKLLENNLPTTGGLWKKTKCYFYHLEILNQGTITDYYIVDPYNQKVYYLPRSYFFIDGSMLA